MGALVVQCVYYYTYILMIYMSIYVITVYMHLRRVLYEIMVEALNVFYTRSVLCTRSIYVCLCVYIRMCCNAALTSIYEESNKRLR